MTQVNIILLKKKKKKSEYNQRLEFKSCIYLNIYAYICHIHVYSLFSWHRYIAYIHNLNFYIIIVTKIYYFIIIYKKKIMGIDI
jgi:hypothetical protein